MIAVICLGIIYAFVTFSLQGVISPHKLGIAGDNGTALVTVARALGGSGWEKVMALSLALSVIASTGTGIVLISRLIYGMASQRVLPVSLASVSRRFSTPVVATVVIGIVLLIATLIFLLISSIQNAFFDVIAVTGILYAAFYVLTALATIAYFRRRVMSNFSSALVLGVLPLLAAAFLVWLMERSIQTQSTAIENWTIGVVLVLGLILMLVARYGLRSPFFQLPRESDES